MIPVYMKTYLQFASDSLKALAEQDDGSDYYNDMYMLCSFIAYNQISAYLDRQFVNDGSTKIQNFFDVNDAIQLPDRPVNSIVRVSIPAILGGSATDLETDSYRLINTDLLKIDTNLDYNELEVEYSYGDTVIQDNMILLSAVTTQGLSIFKRKDFVAMTSSDSLNPSNMTLSDIPILKSVLTMLEALRIY